jgi:hypothetical protein
MSQREMLLDATSNTPRAIPKAILPTTTGSCNHSSTNETVQRISLWSLGVSYLAIWVAYFGSYHYTPRSAEGAS